MLNHRLEVAISAAYRSGTMLRQSYTTAKTVKHKGQIDLLTEYDLRSEAILSKEIQDTFPEDAILSEESYQPSSAERYWLIDPIDGTTNFVHGLPEFAISMAYMCEGKAAIGVIYNPVRDELFHAVKGEGAFLNDQPIHVSTETNLSQSLLSSGFPYDPDQSGINMFSTWRDVFYRSRGIRHIGCASMNTAYIAAGRLDGYWEIGIHPWDLAAGVVLVTEAGGKVTRLDGGQDPLLEPCSILATNGFLHDELMNTLDRQVPRER